MADSFHTTRYAATGVSLREFPALPVADPVSRVSDEEVNGRDVDGRKASNKNGGLLGGGGEISVLITCTPVIADHFFIFYH